ncbi:PREDICTED: uncharacterized protein LOC108662699 [Theobroma cacao]|uniref:Uncharacterized protein LOC108662699 n=1 Tax=Theobroma cacao TaxID=3641 RepID=A0AB32WLS1_THECC|nr:PREDICTED: uncharacterized protein LOC108662699 [Theobroma cacao]
MKSYLKAFNIWDAVETGVEPALIYANPTIAQMKQHEENIAKRYKALSCLQSALSYDIFVRIMHLENPKEVWDHLKDEFQGSERTKQNQVLNLNRQFEMLSMDDNESVREFSGKLMGIVNQLRLLGKAILEDRLVSKMLVSLPEKYESKISSLEDSKDLSQLTLKELVNALEGLEQKRAFRQKKLVDSALVARTKTLKSGGSNSKRNVVEKKEKREETSG